MHSQCLLFFITGITSPGNRFPSCGVMAVGEARVSSDATSGTSTRTTPRWVCVCKLTSLITPSNLAIGTADTDPPEHNTANVLPTQSPFRWKVAGRKSVSLFGFPANGWGGGGVTRIIEPIPERWLWVPCWEAVDCFAVGKEAFSGGRKCWTDDLCNAFTLSSNKLDVHRSLTTFMLSFFLLKVDKSPHQLCLVIVKDTFSKRHQTTSIT